jgi:hypothetical protein
LTLCFSPIINHPFILSYHDYSDIPCAANDDEIRRFLRDERLQNVIKDIDSAQNRETALKSMLKAPNFKEFTDKVLGRIAPPEFLEMND